MVTVKFVEAGARVEAATKIPEQLFDCYHPVSGLFDAAAAGNRKAAADLLPLGYDESRRLATGRMMPY